MSRWLTILGTGIDGIDSLAPAAQALLAEPREHL